MEVSRPEILLISRFNNDFERNVATADFIDQFYPCTLFHEFAIERIPNQLMHRFLKGCRFKLIDFSHLSILERIHNACNRAAREFSSNRFWRLGQWFKSKARNKLKEAIHNFLDSHQFKVLVMTPTPRSSQFPFLCEIYDYFRERGLPVLILNHGVWIQWDRSYDLPDDSLVGEYLLYSCPFHREHVVDPQQFKEHILTGDPRLSLPFMNRLMELVDYEKGKNKLGIYLPSSIQEDEDFQDVVLENLKLLESESEWDEIKILCHPNSTPTEFIKKVDKISDAKCHWRAENSLQLLMELDTVITPPSTIVFEAMILDKKILILDIFDGETMAKNYLDFGIPVILPEELKDYDLDSLPKSYNEPALIENAWGNCEGKDGRVEIQRLLDRILKDCVKS